MSELKYYALIEGIEGPVKVKGFEKCFELSQFQEGGIRNSHQGSASLGSAFKSHPVIDSVGMVLKNPNGKMTVTLQKKTLDAEPLKSVTVSEITKIKGEEGASYQVKFTNPHLLFFRRGVNDVVLELGSYTEIEYTHNTIDETGKKEPFKVTFKIAEDKTS